jgi:Flp pilus assembly protein TadG
MLKLNCPGRARPNVFRDRRGVVAMWVAVTTPVVAMGLGLGVDVTEWVIANQQLQRAADAAATAGSIKYGLLASNAQQAAGFAADVAEANGVSGTATRTWTAGSKTLVANNITVVVGSAVTSGDNSSVAVTVRRVVAPTFSKVFTANSKTITATSTADSIGGGTVNSYQQPCLFGLGQQGPGSPQISFTGGVSVTLTGCAIQSNEKLWVDGGSTVNVGTVYANTAVSVTGGSHLNATTSLQNQGSAVADPYAGNTSLNAAIAQLANTANKPAANVGFAGTILAAGIYPSLTVSGGGTLTMLPGLYVIKGNISFGGGGTIKGTGVTIVSGGSLGIDGGAVVTLSAPTVATATLNAVPAILFASNVNNTGTGNYTGKIGGGATATLAGVIYFPTSNFDLEGGAFSGGGTSSCLEIIANAITVAGGATMTNTGCSAMGAARIGPPGTITAGSAKLLF